YGAANVNWLRPASDLAPANIRCAGVSNSVKQTECRATAAQGDRSRLCGTSCDLQPIHALYKPGSRKSAFCCSVSTAENEIELNAHSFSEDQFPEMGAEVLNWEGNLPVMGKNAFC